MLLVTDFFYDYHRRNGLKLNSLAGELILIRGPITDLQYMHCPKNNLTLRVQTEPVAAGSDPTVKVCFFLHESVLKIRHTQLRLSNCNKLSFHA